MIEVETIVDIEFDSFIQTYDDQIKSLKQQFQNQIEIKSYGNLLRLGLNTIRPEAFDNIFERIEVNRELETALDNVGGYTIDALDNKNPKVTLNNIIGCAKNKSLKSKRLMKYLSGNLINKTIVADKSDIEYLSSIIKNTRTNICTFKDLKRKDFNKDKLILYSFNGAIDFDFLYNLSANIVLILYQQENELYKKQLHRRKAIIENEIISPDRYGISSILYEPLPEVPIHLSETIEDIVNRLDERRVSDYNSYREESDLLLDEIDENITYEIRFNNQQVVHINSNETVFAETNDLIRANRVNVEDKIRVYPNEQFAEKLYQVAVETDKDIFGKIEEHSRLWQQWLLDLNDLYKNSLYEELKKYGLKVLPFTVQSYIDKKRKFPMFNNDLRAVAKCRFQSLSDKDIDFMLAPIRKSKSTFNSTMIVLGRGLKQEIKLFLKQNKIGEILDKLQFNYLTLQIFVDEYMPLLIVKNKDVYKSNSEKIEEILSRFRK